MPNTIVKVNPTRGALKEGFGKCVYAIQGGLEARCQFGLSARARFHKEAASALLPSAPRNVMISQDLICLWAFGGIMPPVAPAAREAHMADD